MTTNHLVSEDAIFNGIVQLSHRNRETLTAAFLMVEGRATRTETKFGVIKHCCFFVSTSNRPLWSPGERPRNPGLCIAGPPQGMCSSRWRPE
jgi:hypothetical protein